MVVVFFDPVVNRALFFEPTPRSNIDLAADDGLDPMLHSLLIKFDGAKHVAMIGHRQRGHAVRADPLDERLDAVCPV